MIKAPITSGLCVWTQKRRRSGCGTVVQTNDVMIASSFPLSEGAIAFIVLFTSALLLLLSSKYVTLQMVPSSLEARAATQEARALARVPECIGGQVTSTALRDTKKSGIAGNQANRFQQQYSGSQVPVVQCLLGRREHCCL